MNKFNEYHSLLSSITSWSSLSLSDDEIKKIFTENEDMLHSFVASMLDIPQESISEIKITNPELPLETLAGKNSSVHLLVRRNKRRNEKHFIVMQLLYYSFRKHTVSDVERIKSSAKNGKPHFSLPGY